MIYQSDFLAGVKMGLKSYLLLGIFTSLLPRCLAARSRGALGCVNSSPTDG